MTSTTETYPDAAGEMGLVQLEAEPFMPALSTEQAVARFNAVVEFVRTVMREGVDYGNIPGTDKPTLLKPGAEKLCTLFGLSSRMRLVHSVEDWMGREFEGEPFFYYLYRCQLRRGDMVIAEGDGSCNSFEQKYRYREAQRRCPSCGQPAIIRGREEYGGGWLCFRKRNGCGAKFALEDPQITGQVAGRVPNENIADQVNTVQKMAQKRALIAATLLAVNGSEFFTQDIEDRLVTIEAVDAPDAKPAESAEKGNGKARRQELLDRCGDLCRLLKSRGHEAFRDKAAIVAHLRQTAEGRGWEAGPLNALSDLPDGLLAEYGGVLEELAGVTRR